MTPVPYLFYLLQVVTITLVHQHSPVSTSDLTLLNRMRDNTILSTTETVLSQVRKPVSFHFTKPPDRASGPAATQRSHSMTHRHIQLEAPTEAAFLERRESFDMLLEDVETLADTLRSNWTRGENSKSRQPTSVTFFITGWQPYHVLHTTENLHGTIQDEANTLAKRFREAQHMSSVAASRSVDIRQVSSLSKVNIGRCFSSSLGFLRWLRKAQSQQEADRPADRPLEAPSERAFLERRDSFDALLMEADTMADDLTNHWTKGEIDGSPRQQSRNILLRTRRRRNSTSLTRPKDFIFPPRAQTDPGKTF
ncbi:hypothetical protein PROFUN_06586 [Planoprotostelium fungivorum]|uniref:Uncharacterized protein n=1 Tax=Planoprotostelium fungivorum TaxID=1890364 RepID=A0A2P6MRY2_9EUKA|nr:hypothetical protein PROFUN_06586 [Planoprotostelium fungivorum]